MQDAGVTGAARRGSWRVALGALGMIWALGAGPSWAQPAETELHPPGVVRLSPTVRRLPPHEAIAPLPLAAVQAFVGEHHLLDPAAPPPPGYVVAGAGGRLLSGAGDRIYARGRLTPGSRYAVYRPGARYRDPVSGAPLGRALMRIGLAQAQAQTDQTTELTLLRASREVRGDDLLLPQMTQALPANFMPRRPERAVAGQLLALPGDARRAGRLDVVALNRGREDGLAEGHVLAVAPQDTTLADPRDGATLSLPERRTGLVMVFRPYARLSYALVLEATAGLAAGDRIYRPDTIDPVAP